MRLLFIAAALALPVAGVAAVPRATVKAPASKLDCPSAFQVHRADEPNRLRAQRLGDLPPGNLSLAVLREVNGCPEPTVIRYGYGAASQPRRKAPASKR